VLPVGSFLARSQATMVILHHRKAVDWSWQPKVRLVKACRGTGITAISWDGEYSKLYLTTDANIFSDVWDMRVYFQDEGCRVCQLVGNFDDDRSW
jgi:hypothetical protein